MSPALAGGFLTTAPPGKSRHILFKNCYVFLENQPLYPNVMPFVIPETFLTLKSVLPEIDVATPAFF